MPSSFLAHLLSAAHTAVVSHFLLLWFICLILIALAGAWLARTSNGISDPAPRLSSTPAAPHSPSRPRESLAPSDILAAVLFVLFLASYIAAIFYHDDFAFFDNDQLTDFSLRGHSLPPPIWPADGRFFPLAFQEFNALRFLTRSPAGYHSLAVAQLLIVLLAAALLLRPFKLRHRLLAVSALMLGPAFAISFSGLIYPERDVLFWLALLLVSLYAYSQTRSRLAFVAALIATHFILYYKETVVVLIVAFAAFYLFLQLRARDRSTAAPYPWRTFARENSLYLAMLAVSAIYAAFFLAALFPHATSSYVLQHREPLRSVLQTYLVIDWLPWLLLAVFLFNVLRPARLAFPARLSPLHSLWNALAFAALAYFAAIFSLRLITAYYLAPVDLIALLYLARLFFAWVEAPVVTIAGAPHFARKLNLALAFATLLCLLLHDAAFSSFRIVERKSLIASSRQLADLLHGYTPPSSQNSSIELFFPFASGQQLLALSAYLKYKGISLADSAASSDPPAQFVITGSAPLPDNRCMPYRNYACFHAAAPAPGALVIILPDDNIDAASVAKFASAHGSAQLVHFAPPKFVAGKNSWFRSLYVISPEFAATGLPQHWLQLDVFQSP